MSSTTIKCQIGFLGNNQTGKTTYLGAVLAQPDLYRSDCKGIEIKPMNDRAKDIQKMTINLLKDGQVFASTVIKSDYDLDINIPKVKHYDDINVINKVRQLMTSSKIKHSNRIKIVDKVKHLITPPRGVRLRLTIQDYPGESFNGTVSEEETKGYVKQWTKLKGLAIFFSEWENGEDTAIYKPMVERILTSINSKEYQKMHIAFIFNKCERGEIWAGRLEPEEDLFEERLKETKKVIESGLPRDRYRYFAASAFGVLGKCDLRPNRIREDRDCLKEPNKWRPHGLISPLYWLATQKVLYDSSL
jgi:hypothetical protein